MNPDFEITPEEASMLVAQIQATVEEQEGDVKPLRQDMRAHQQYLDEIDAILAANAADGAGPEESETETAPPPPEHLVPASQIPTSSSSLLYG